MAEFALATGASIVTNAEFEARESIQVVPCNYEHGEFLQGSVVYLLLSVNRSFELRYFGTKDSGFCRPFALHIINFNASEYLLVGHIVSSYINILTRDVTFCYSYYLVM